MDNIDNIDSNDSLYSIKIIEGDSRDISHSSVKYDRSVIVVLLVVGKVIIVLTVKDRYKNWLLGNCDSRDHCDTSLIGGGSNFQDSSEQWQLSWHWHYWQ